MYRKTIGAPHRYLAKKFTRWWKDFWEMNRRTVIGVIGSIILVTIIYLVTNMIIYSPTYTIERVSITHEVSSTTQLDTITQYIKQVVGGHESYLALRTRERDDDERVILDAFPLIKSVDLLGFEENTVRLSVSYYEPQIIWHLPSGEELGSYEEYIYPLDPEYVITDRSAILFLPSYLTDIETLDGIYHENSEAELVNVYHTVNEQIPLQHMIVYPGAGYVAMKTVDDLKVLFSLRKPIEDQMTLYSAIYQNYDEAYRIRQIDVGSLDDAIVTLE